MSTWNTGIPYSYPAVANYPAVAPPYQPAVSSGYPAGFVNKSSIGADQYIPTTRLATAQPSLSPEISMALQLLYQIQHHPLDEQYIKQLGVNLLFTNGAQAYQLIRQKNIRVEFGDMGDSKAHAEWQKDQNTIRVNQKYRGDMSPATLYAISEAIYHEAGHAACLGNEYSSIQEEIDCLALNVLGHRYHTSQDPLYAQTVSASRLISDGVALYARLFFDPDPEKKALVKRIIDIYGELPPDSPDHPIPMLSNGQIPLCDRVLRTLKNMQVVATN